MKFTISLLSLLLYSLLGVSQIRMDKLVVHSQDTFKIIDSDIIVVDTLVMENSSVIVLNRDKEDNFIHAKVMLIGSNCFIIGNGGAGIDGEKGLPGYTATGPCKNGIPGRNGTSGTPGQSGVNLYLYFNELTITDKLSFRLSGGDGGDGGRGGNGGGGSPGTRLCQGGNGGNGGAGGRGGNGGNGGTLTFSCKICPNMRIMLTDKIAVRSYGGNGGLSGDGGLGGLPGLVNSGNNSADGEQGARGKTGGNGDNGKPGAINFEQN